MYPIEYKPSATDDLIRVGARFDGGYVLPKRILQATRSLLSFGLGDQWEFEREFSKGLDFHVICFDHSVSGYFWLKQIITNICFGFIRRDATKFRRAFRYFDYLRYFDGKRHIHVKKALGYSGTGTVTLSEAIETCKLKEPVFLKMDIEGWEYRLLGDLVSQRSRFSGLAVEFHHIDLHEDRIVKFINDIADEFILVHLHLNSHTTVGPGGMALVVEMTFMNKKLLRDGETLSYHALPISGLDAPNLPGEAEVTPIFCK